MNVGENVLWLMVASGILAIFTSGGEAGDTAIAVGAVAASASAIIWVRRRNRTDP